MVQEMLMMKQESLELLYASRRRVTSFGVEGHAMMRFGQDREYFPQFLDFVKC